MPLTASARRSPALTREQHERNQKRPEGGGVNSARSGFFRQPSTGRAAWASPPPCRRCTTCSPSRGRPVRRTVEADHHRAGNVHPLNAATIHGLALACLVAATRS
ncbi:hypothetical protein ACRAWF_26685 [Streptomyces sp. L7]